MLIELNYEEMAELFSKRLFEAINGELALEDLDMLRLDINEFINKLREENI